MNSCAAFWQKLVSKEERMDGFSKESYRLVFDNMQTDSIKLRFFFFSSLLTSSTHQTQLHNLYFLQKCSFKQDLSSTSSALSAFMLSLQCCCGNMLIWVKKKKCCTGVPVGSTLPCGGLLTEGKPRKGMCVKVHLSSFA